VNILDAEKDNIKEPHQTLFYKLCQLKEYLGTKIINNNNELK